MECKECGSEMLLTDISINEDAYFGEPSTINNFYCENCSFCDSEWGVF